MRVHPDRLDRPAKGSTTGWIAGLALAVVAVVVGIERHGDCEVVPCLRIGGLRLLAGWRTRLRKGIQNKRMELSSQYDRRFNYELRWTSTGLLVSRRPRKRVRITGKIHDPEISELLCNAYPVWRAL